jgi:hypothetical protein
MRAVGMVVVALPRSMVQPTPAVEVAALAKVVQAVVAEVARAAVAVEELAQPGAGQLAEVGPTQVGAAVAVAIAVDQTEVMVDRA